MALIAPSLAKLLWRQALRGVAWRALVLWTAVACAVVTLAGLLLFGHDGKMATYAAMVLAAAAALWWRGFGSAAGAR
jgi:hypothetical protein